MEANRGRAVTRASFSMPYENVKNRHRSRLPFHSMATSIAITRRSFVAVQAAALPAEDFFFFRFATEKEPLDSVLCTMSMSTVIDGARAVW